MDMVSSFLLDKLSIRQKSALLGLAKRMMIADAKVKVEEDALFQMLRNELGRSVHAPTRDVFGDIDVSAFDDKFSKLVLLIVLITMAYIDDNLHPSESTVLNEVIPMLDLPKEIVDEAMSLAERQGELVRNLVGLFGKL